MKLELPKKKLYIARALRYGGLAAALISCVIGAILAQAAVNGAIVACMLILVFYIIMVIGQAWIVNLYKCPKCESKLLPWRGGRYSSMGKMGLENNCPEFCPHCGTKIVVEISNSKNL